MLLWLLLLLLLAIDPNIDASSKNHQATFVDRSLVATATTLIFAPGVHRQWHWPRSFRYTATFLAKSIAPSDENECRYSPSWAPRTVGWRVAVAGA